MAASLLPLLKARFDNILGGPLAGGLVYTYVAGTSTPLASYTDTTGLVANPNPVVLNSSGEANIYLDTAKRYKVVVRNALGVLQYTTDNVVGAGSTSPNAGGVYDVTAYGAIGDNLTDNTLTLQAAITACEAGGGQLYFPAGTYRTGSLTYTKVFNWFGDSNFTSILKYIGTGGYMLAASVGCAVLIGSSMTDLWLQGPGNATGTSESGFIGRLNGSNRDYTFNRVRCSNFHKHGFEITDSFGISFYDCYILTNGSSTTGGGGVHFRRQSYTDVSSTGNRFYNCYMASPNWCVGTPNNVADQMLGSAFHGCFFESSKYGVFSPRTRELSMVGCYFEDISVAGAAVSSLTDIECYYNTLLATNVPICTGARKSIRNSNTEFSYNGTAIFTIDHNDITTHIAQATFASGALKLTTFGDSRIYRISGSSPEGVTTAGVGSICIRADSANASQMLYVKETGTGNTGWKALISGTTLAGTVNVASATIFTGPFNTAVGAPLWQGNAGASTIFGVAVPTGGSGTSAQFRAYGGTDPANTTFVGARSTATEHTFTWGDTVAGVAADPTADLLFEGGGTFAIYAAVAASVTPTAARHLTRKDYVDLKHAGSGVTASRPVGAARTTGTMYFDTTIGKPVWYNGSGWVDATGTAA